VKTGVLSAMRVALLAIVCLASLTASANAQSVSVALVDVSFLFKNHPRFQHELETMKTEVEQREGELRASRDQLNTIRQEQTKFQPGSPEYKQYDQQLATKTADLQARAALLRKEFLQREASIYHRAYNEITTEIKTFCEPRGIFLVLQFSGDTIDVNDPQSVMKELNKPVVYYHGGIDITPAIKQALETRFARR
jgi:Skp family chaperone for outer membrane proteins